MKYVMFSNDEFRMFDNGVSHADVAHEVLNLRPGLRVRSAGFVQFSVDEVKSEEEGWSVIVACCYGESDSLGAKTDPKDDRYINSAIKRGLF